MIAVDEKAVKAQQSLLQEKNREISKLRGLLGQMPELTGHIKDSAWAYEKKYVYVLMPATKTMK